MLTLSLLPLLEANLVILHGVSQTLLSEFLVVSALTHGFSVLEKPCRNLWILAGTALYYTFNEVHIFYPKLEDNTIPGVVKKDKYKSAAPPILVIFRDMSPSIN